MFLVVLSINLFLLLFFISFSDISNIREVKLLNYTNFHQIDVHQFIFCYFHLWQPPLVSKRTKCS